MKKITLILLALPLLISAQTNLIQNGGFENWKDRKPENWTIENNVTQNTTDAIEGNSCASLKLTVRRTDPLVLAKVKMAKGKEYILSFKYKYVDSNYGGRHPITYKIVNTNIYSSVNSSLFASDNKWTKVTEEITPENDGTFDISIYTGTFNEEGFEVLIDDVKVTATETASIKNETFSSKVSFYPNPVKNTLNISADNNNINNVTIYSILGKKVIDTKQQKIDISNLHSGMYILKAQGKNNNIAIKKFIKE